jgi:hypothetical protein
MRGGLGPDVVGNRIRAIAEARHGFGERERGALGVGEVGRLAPGRDREQAVVALAGLSCFTDATVDARTAAVDLARAQVDEAQRRLGRAGLAGNADQRLDCGDRARHDRGRVLDSGLHGSPPVTSVRAGPSTRMTDRGGEM